MYMKFSKTIMICMIITYFIVNTLIMFFYKYDSISIVENIYTTSLCISDVIYTKVIPDGRIEYLLRANNGYLIYMYDNKLLSKDEIQCIKGRLINTSEDDNSNYFILWNVQKLENY